MFPQRTSSSVATDWQQRASYKREQLTAAIPREWLLKTVPPVHATRNILDFPRTVLSANELAITESSGQHILQNIADRTWSAEDVTRAFCHRAAIAQQLLNCLSEIMFANAIAAARALDQLYQRTGKLKGPLHGLPMSFMDRYRIDGVESACGFVSWLGYKDDHSAESLIVRHMRELGAIPFCKTIVPQSMMLATTSNNIFGSVMNPFDRLLSAGGAAGGEGALQGMNGSPFGWATEIAGSTRMPANFQALYSLKVTSGRLPNQGIASTSTSLPLCGFNPSPMCSDLPTLQYVTQLTLGIGQYLEDPVSIDMPWRDSKFLAVTKRRPRFALVFNDAHVQPQPPVLRALDLVSAALRAQNYDIVPWIPPSHADAVETLFRILGADGASEIRKAIRASGEPPVSQLRSWYFDQEAGQITSTRDFWALCKSRKEFLDKYNKYWLSTADPSQNLSPIDGVILPVTADAACIEGGISYFGYSAVVNTLDYTAVSFPVTSADRALDLPHKNFRPLSPEDESVNKAYDPNGFHGMPIGLQVMCRKFEEETALALAGIIAKALRTQQNSP